MKVGRSNLINVGRTAGVFGIKGWVKVISNTEPKDGIVKYLPWWLKTRHGAKIFDVDDYKFQNDNLIVHFKGVDDRDAAALLSAVDIAIEKSQLPPLEEGDFYWHQLIGMEVNSVFEGRTCSLGKVKNIVETGANDVLLVVPSENSVDQRERLVPYVPGLYIESVDAEQNVIYADWDPEF